MEELLDLYAQPYDPKRPVVCFDEASKQLLSDLAPPQAMQPGRAARWDYEYRREGTANLFLAVEPLRGWRSVTVTSRRTKQDFARPMQILVDEVYPLADVVRVVLDNLNTHGFSSLYETFPPAEAWRLCQRLEFHHTPKHASWLNMAEMEFSVLARQCLDRRLASREQLIREIAAWEAARNAAQVRLEWLFRVDEARERLQHLYPVKNSVDVH